jgi:3-hydroxybutyryl-CoA dehydrogenase
MGEIKTVGVIGAGTMGSGIAHVFARAGFEVLLCDVEQRFLERALGQIRTNLGREAAKGKLAEVEVEASVARLKTTVDREALGAADFAIEAAPERFDLKADVFRAMDRILPEGAVLATNTSSISITKIAAVTKRPGQVIGMHFFNPVPVMALIEVVRGMATSNATFATVRDLAVRLGKTPVEVNDAPGFVSNRVLMPLINEAAFAVMEGVATPESVDQVFKLGMAHPMGPLTLADFIGIDVCVDILRVLHEGFGNPKYSPCPMLVRMVDAGWLGRKTGRGFYTYEK